MKDILNQIKKYWIPVLWGFIVIIASAGAMNTGEGIYIVAGIANMIINGFEIYKHTKQDEKD